MKLNEVIEQIKAFDGYKHHRLRATDHSGLVQCYTFWFERNNDVKNYEIRFLVINKDTVEEEAWVYSTKHIQVKPTPFEDEVRQKIPQFQSSNPEYEKITITFINEADEIAELCAYKYDVQTTTSKKIELVIFKKDGELIARKLE